jgi:hypothetical protein
MQVVRFGGAAENDRLELAIKAKLDFLCRKGVKSFY